jgi:hypothetical protein
MPHRRPRHPPHLLRRLKILRPAYENDFKYKKALNIKNH